MHALNQSAHSPNPRTQPLPRTRTSDRTLQIGTFSWIGGVIIIIRWHERVHNARPSGRNTHDPDETNSMVVSPLHEVADVFRCGGVLTEEVV